MKKKLNFLLSLILVLAVCACAFVTPASSFQNDVVTSSYAMLMINLDTRTPVYTLRADKVWYASYQSELMTFLLMCENVDDPSGVRVKVDKDFIDGLKHSDGCLEKYLGDELTLKDLAAIMLLTPGSDAAYLIADYVGGGDVDAFIDSMNTRAAQIGCKKTSFRSPGYSEAKDHLTTCSDLSRIYNRLMNNELYKEIMSSPTYIPEKYGEDEAYAVTTENSIMNPVSPYYFRYATGGKFAYDPTAGASITVTTSYKNMNYLFIALRGKNEAEQNVFTDARRMTTWAYLNLSDRKVVDTNQPVDQATAVSVWGEYEIDLYADNSARKTLPNEYEQSKFSVKMDVPDKLNLPLFKGEQVGSADIYYDGERIDRVRIVPNQDEGAAMLTDLRRFGDSALKKLFPNSIDQYVAEDEAGDQLTEPPTKEQETQPAKQKDTTNTDQTDAEE